MGDILGLRQRVVRHPDKQNAERPNLPLSNPDPSYPRRGAGARRVPDQQKWQTRYPRNRNAEFSGLHIRLDSLLFVKSSGVTLSLLRTATNRTGLFLCHRLRTNPWID